MKPTVTMETRRGALGEFLLISIVNGKGTIGLCDTSAVSGTTRETLYVEGESLINTLSPANDRTANRQIWQCSSIDKCQGSARKLFEDAAEEFFYENAPLSKAVYPVLELLTDGIYVVHVDKAYPTDGAGNFFWNAYLVRHELNGSAPFNPVFGEEKCYSPPFLVPTRSCSTYDEQNMNTALSRLRRGRRIGGIAYHLSGMFSALLGGHMNAAACVKRGGDFPCIMIEPLTDVLYTQDEAGAVRVAGLGCPYIKLPIAEISRNMIECFLLNRRSTVPEFYGAIRAHAEKILQPKNAIKDMPLLTKHAEALPDAEMLASAFAVEELTDEQLDLLLSGETMQNEQVIISQNYYESVVYACNFLQYTSPERFIRFTISVLSTPALSATFRYVAERLRYTMDAKINEVFTEVQNSEDPAYLPLKEAAKQYTDRYAEYMEENVKSFMDDDDDEPAVPEAKRKIEAAKAEVASPPEGRSSFSSMALKKEMERSTAAKPAEE